MSKPVVEVQLRAIAAADGGFAVFLGNQEKAFVIFVDQSVGAAIAMFMQGRQKERPLTHDLVANILRALGVKIEKAIVNDLKLGTYKACPQCGERTRTEENHRLIDARPSDCIAMATAQRAPIYVSLEVWQHVDDMTEALRQIHEEGSHPEESGEEEGP